MNLLRSVLNLLPSNAYIAAYEPGERMMALLQVGLSGAKTHLFSDLGVIRNDLEVRRIRLDVITCLEVLEHLPLPERLKFYDFAAESLDDQGILIIEVPVELGPTLLIKALGRCLLKGRAPDYRPAALLKGVFGFVAKDSRRFDPESRETFINPHSGFDYRRLRREIAARFDIVEALTMPLRWMPAWAGNQCVTYVARKKRHDGGEELEASRPSAASY